MQKFKVKYDNLICPVCGEKIYIHKIWDKLKEQYEPNTGADGYPSILMSNCTCGKRLKIVFDCHEGFGHSTAVVNRIITS